MKKAAIITVDYNNHTDTGEFLTSVRNLDTTGVEIMTLVVDNGSDQSAAETVKKYPGTIWLQTGKNGGFAGGYNRGIEYAREWGAEYFLLINNDTLIGDKLLLRKLVRALDKFSGSGMVSPKMYFAPGFEFHKDRYQKADLGRVIWYAGGKFDWNNIRSVHRGIDEIDSGQYTAVEETGFVSGCCVMVRREVIEKAGLLDEGLALYFEDADWVMRISHAGWKQIYCGETFIFHKVSRTAGIGSPLTDYMLTRNRLYFGMKYAPAKTRLALIREAVKLLITGRPAQKQGIVDYFKKVKGMPNQMLDARCQMLEYPVELSINILNYKTTNLILKLLISIYDEKSGIEKINGVEVVVLDNSPEDSCRREVVKKFPQVKFIQNPVNNGFPAGHNQTVKYSLGKYILLLNSDIEVKPGGLEVLVKTARKNGDEKVYVGKLSFPDGEVQDSCFRLPTITGAVKEYFLKIKGSYFMYRPQGSKPVAVEGAVMACFMIPRKVINQIGLLTERVFMYFEDIDYCRRLKQVGIPIYYVPQAEFIHHHGQASKQAGTELSNTRLIEAAVAYHGRVYYTALSWVLRLAQKFGGVSTPQSRWKNEQ